MYTDDLQMQVTSEHWRACKNEKQALEVRRRWSVRVDSLQLGLPNDPSFETNGKQGFLPKLTVVSARSTTD